MRYEILINVNTCICMFRCFMCVCVCLLFICVFYHNVADACRTQEQIFITVSVQNTHTHAYIHTQTKPIRRCVRQKAGNVKRDKRQSQKQKL